MVFLNEKGKLFSASFVKIKSKMTKALFKLTCDRKCLLKWYSGIHLKIQLMEARGWLQFKRIPPPYEVHPLNCTVK